MEKIRILTTLLAIVITTAVAKAGDYFEKNIGIADGLSQNSVTAIAYDHYGALWIGTRYGLNVYRGQKITSCHGGEDGLQGDYIYSLFIDDFGTLWVSTEKGTQRYDYSTGTISKISDIPFHCAVEKDDTIFFGTTTGLLIYKANRQDELKDSRNGSKQDGHLKELTLGVSAKSIHIHNDDLILVDAQTGIYEIKIKEVLDDGSGTSAGQGKANISDKITKINLPELNKKTIQASELVGDDLYVSAYRSGIYKFDLIKGSGKGASTSTSTSTSTDADTSPLHFTTSNSGLTYDVVMSMKQVGNELWLATDGGGICIMDLGDSRNMIRSADVTFDSIITLEADPLGNIWAGTVRDGVYGLRKTMGIKIYDTANSSLAYDIINWLCPDTINRTTYSRLSAKTYPATRNTEQTTSTTSTTNAYQGASRFIWLGTDGRGVSRMDTRTGAITSIRSTGNLKISSLAKLDDTHLLLSVYSEGLKTMDTHTGRLENFTLLGAETDLAETLSSDPPLVYSNGNNVLISARNAYAYDTKTHLFRRFLTQEAPPENNIHLFEFAGDKAYGYTTGRIFKLDFGTCTMEGTRPNINDEAIQAAAIVNSTIWIGTDHGLFYMNNADDKASRLETGMFQRVTALSSDGCGNLWIAADNGLFRLKNGKLQIFGDNEGFAPNEILYMMQSNGELYLASTKGLVRITTPDMSLGHKSPTPQFFRITVDGSTVQPKNGRLKLKHAPKRIDIQTMIPDGDPLDRQLYKYSIKRSNGVDIESYDNTLTMNDLRPGNYTIGAACLDTDGQWGAQSELVRMKILPPWYRSWWFMTLCSLLAAAAVYKLVVWELARRVKRIEQRLREDNEDFLNRLDGYIADNLSDSEMSIPGLCVHMAMSRASLYAKVKKVTGMGVGQYIDEARLKKARQLLQETNLSIAEVSDDTGFSTGRYFSTWFKKKTGMTPRQFRTSPRP